jgi:hypothetical protein
MIRRIVLVLLAVVLLPMLGAADCADDGPGTPSYNRRHHLTDTPDPAMPNPDPDPPRHGPSPKTTVHTDPGDDPRHAPERRGPGRPPQGKYVTFSVSADRTMGTILVTWRVGGGKWQTFHMNGTKHWGTVATVGTPVAVLAAPDKASNPDGTFKHGLIDVRITREPANETEGGPIICQKDNSPGHTGGAQCAGTV